MKDGDILQYDLIEKRLTDKPSIKGIALSSRSIEKVEKLKLNEMYESDEGIQIDRDSIVSKKHLGGGSSERERILKPKKAR